MVRALYYTAVLGILLISAASAQEEKPLTGDDIREMLQPSESEHARRARELKYNEMHRLYRVTKNPDGNTDSGDTHKNKQKTPIEGRGPTSPEKGQNATNIDKVLPPEETDKQKKAPQVADKKQNSPAARFQKDRYVPPSWTSTQHNGGFGVDQVKRRGPRFGIRLGTRVYGEIRRSVTNAERNLCEIHLTKDIVGDIETMGRGTIIFAAKEFNNSTKLLELRTVKGITPDGVEFRINAYGMDINEVAGLSGTITTDGKSTKRSISRGGFEVGKSLATTLNDGTVLGAGIESATKNMLDEKETETHKTLNEPQYIIRVEPQPVILMVETTF